MEYLFRDFRATFDFHVYFEIGYLKVLFVCFVFLRENLTLGKFQFKKRKCVLKVKLVKIFENSGMY